VLSTQPVSFLLIPRHILLHFRAMMEVVTDDGVHISQVEHIKIFDDLFRRLALPLRCGDRV